MDTSPADTSPARPRAEARPSEKTGVGRSLGRWKDVRPWVGTLARLTLAAVFAAAGGSKVTDLAASGRAVNAYHILPTDMGRVLGSVLPLVELTLAVLLLVGLATRLVSALVGGLLVVFIGGIASAWARGLNIDCGCFGGDGSLSAGKAPTYGWEVLRDTALLALAVFVVVYPRTRFSVDSRLAISEEFE